MSRLSIRLPVVKVPDPRGGLKTIVITPGSPDAKVGETVTVFLENEKHLSECVVEEVSVVPANQLRSDLKMQLMLMDGETVAECVGSFYGITELPEDIPLSLYVVRSIL